MSAPRIDVVRLRRRRLELHLSQAELARAAGMSAGHLGALERDGQQALVTLDQVTRLAERLDLPWAELLPAPPAQPAPPPLISTEITRVPGEAAADTEQALIDDARELAAVLVPRTSPLSRDAAARLLGWTLRRVVDAAAALAQQLPAVGLQLTRSGHDLLVHPVDAYKDVPSLAQSQRREQIRRQLRPATMLALLRLRDDLPVNDLNGWEEIQAELLAAGLVEPYEGEVLLPRSIERSLSPGHGG